MLGLEQQRSNDRAAVGCRDRKLERHGGRGGGANAEYVVAALDVLQPIPPGMDYAAAAGLPLAGMTALQGLRDACRLPMHEAGQRVLIIGASGGVGHFAVQIARAAGATVVGVCSGRNAELVRRLGATTVIDYTGPDPYAGVKPFEVIYDCVGSAPGPFLPLLTPTGRFASCMPGIGVLAQASLNAVRGRKVLPVMLTPNAADLGVLDALVAAGSLEVVIAARFPLGELPAAWALSRSGRVAGKIVVDV